MAIFGINTSYLTTYLNLRKIEDGKLSPSTNPPTHPPNRIIKKIGFQKGGLPIQNRRLKFRSPEQYSKRKSIGPHGSASTSLRGIQIPFDILYLINLVPEMCFGTLVLATEIRLF